MDKGTIGKILDYYFSNPEFSGDIESAMIEFFGTESIQDLKKINIKEGEMELFGEWFVFDYQWSGKKTTLFKFYHDNPLRLSQDSLQIYKNLQNNQYGVWEVVSVNPGHGLRLENLQTGKIFDVKEFKATFQLNPGDIFYNRLAFLKDHWEMVGANTFIWGVKFDQSVKSIWRKDKSEISPKDNYRMFKNNHSDALGFEQNLLTIENAEEKFAKMLKKFKIDSYVTTSLIKDWIYNLKRDSISYTEIIDRLTGLINFDDLDNSLDVGEFIKVYNEFYNLCPQKFLKNKSPSQLITENPSRKPELITRITSIGHGEELDKIQIGAWNFMRSGNYFKALKYFDKYFRKLLQRRTTVFFIYRIYANKAVCHFACGQKSEGKKMIDIALELNPNYDFGRKLLRRYRAGEFDFEIKNILGLKSRFGFQKKDSSEKYYNFLKKLGINFATATLTTSKITIFGSGGKELKIGRNDDYSCGATHPDGHPKKYKRCREK